MRSFQSCEGLSINCINGRPGNKWEFRAEGPSAFSINILLEGRMQAAIDGGSAIDACSGSVILMATGEHTTGWDVLDGLTDSAFRMVCIHLPQASMTRLTGLSMDDLRRRVFTTSGEQTHVDAFLGVMPASNALQRASCDLLGLGCVYDGTCIARDLFMRAKALETIACFLHENMTRKEVVLPAPGDRSRLIEAHAMLEASYGDDWKVSSLARAVGLNENRLQAGFQAMFNTSVHACLISIRIDAAVTMLRRGASVTDTADAVGFAHLSHFSRMFRSRTGITPKQCAMGLSPRVLSEVDNAPLT
ncbi:helix-turn-helix transcriptional regulator [Marinospirillum insulare]|uniref:HTH araC/xylS-type domain-containing protein n=1 Tax=Marinospirillum insulare TaxID=217169 RepID=A0ABQ5ZZK7_9GAMM|nr:AraC family transcriptional regulator [Marinospirillum insulare]GLR64513.1 hypothetical protein GCM10007878_19510 [Marinospirillum insulare]